MSDGYVDLVTLKATLSYISPSESMKEIHWYLETLFNVVNKHYFLLSNPSPTSLHPLTESVSPVGQSTCRIMYKGCSPTVQWPQWQQGRWRTQEQAPVHKPGGTSVWNQAPSPSRYPTQRQATLWTPCPPKIHPRMTQPSGQ